MATKKVNGKKANGKKANGAKANGNGHASGGLGKEGTITRFFQDKLLAGEENAAIVKAAAKKFPEAKIQAYYPAWFRWKMVQKGLIKKAA
jgi:hypothetical protein